MQIHNFLCDLLVSIKLLVDTYFFPHNPGFIKSYQFNLGNRTFQLGPEPSSSYELPAVIVAVQDEQINFMGRRTDLIMKNNMDNINKIPVLYDETSNRYAYVHEEQTVVPFSISFNCESQLQAKEIGFQIKKILPPNKNINILNFTTYLEIPKEILFTLLNYDIQLSNIHNLYTKLNYNTGSPEYCFSLTHNPLVRLDSVSSNFQDSSTSTFQCQVELAYIIPFPQYLIVSDTPIINTINFSFNVENFPIVIIPYTKHYLGDEPNYKIDRTLLLQSENTHFPESVIISKTDLAAYISIKFELNDFIIDTNLYKYRFSKIANNIRDSEDFVPTYTYSEENKIVFVIDLDTYNNRFVPLSTSPLFIDFYYDVTPSS